MYIRRKSLHNIRLALIGMCVCVCVWLYVLVCLEKRSYCERGEQWESTYNNILYLDPRDVSTQPSTYCVDHVFGLARAALRGNRDVIPFSVSCVVCLEKIFFYYTCSSSPSPLLEEENPKLLLALLASRCTSHYRLHAQQQLLNCITRRHHHHFPPDALKFSLLYSSYIPESKNDNKFCFKLKFLGFWKLFFW